MAAREWGVPPWVVRAHASALDVDRLLALRAAEHRKQAWDSAAGPDGRQEIGEIPVGEQGHTRLE